MGSHIVGFNFRSIRYLLPVYRLSQFSTIMANGTIFRRSFLSNYLWQTLDIGYATSVWDAILWDLISDLSDIYFLFTDLVSFQQLWPMVQFSVGVFSVTTYGSLLIFGMLHQYGVPYCGIQFQINTSV